MIFQRRSIFKTGFFILFVFLAVFLIFYEETKKAEAIDGNPCFAQVNALGGSDSDLCTNLPAASYPEYASSVNGSFTLSGAIGYGAGSVRSCILDPSGAGDRCVFFFGGNFSSYSLSWTLSCGGTGCTYANLAVSAENSYEVSASQFLNTGCGDPNANNYLGSGSCTYSVPTATISASPTSIISGQPSTLSWSSSNATSCSSSWGGAKPTSGFESVSPASTTNYSITCFGPGGTSPTASETVNVISPPWDWIHCNGNDGSCSIPYNNGANLDWDSGNTNRCELYRNWAGINTNLPISGGYNTGNLTQSWEYELVCKNSNGDFAIDTVQVNVGPPVYGCTDPAAANYYSSANVDDGSCKYLVNLNFNVSGTCGPLAGAAVTISYDFGNGIIRTTDGSGFANFGVWNNTTIGWSAGKLGYAGQNGSVTSGNRGTTTTVNVNLGNPAGYGNACTVTNACGQSNTGTTQCGGSCSVSAPPNPPGYGNACPSAPNACGMTNTGTIQCDGSCSATTPPNSSCPAPTASLTASPNPVNYNTASTLTWSSTHTHPNSCSIPGLVTNGPTSGSVSTGNLTSNQTYTVTCQGLNGSPVSESVTVTVPAPTADIRCDNINGPCNLSWNGSSLIEWCGSNAQACANAASCSVTRNGSPWASGTSGAQSTGAQIVPGTFTYALTCSGNGSASDNAQVVVANPIPATSNVTVMQPDYCVSGPAATVGWDYSDPAGSPQSSYQVQITNIGNFNNPLYDSCIPAPGSCASGYSSNSNFTGQGVLQFNTTYKARVRTWNGYNQPSAWVESNSFLTPNHAYPNVNPSYQFTWSPLNPAINKPVQFIDRTLFAPTSNNKQWSWVFVPAGGGSGSSTAQSPAYSFNTEGVYQVTERVRDNAMPPGQYCSYTQAINIQKPIPVWKEIAPR